MSQPYLEPNQGPAVRKSFLFVVGSVAIGVCVLAAATATGAFVAFEPETGTLANGAVQVTPSGASGGKAVQFGAGAVTPTPSPGERACAAFPAFPDALCTGVPSGTALTVVTGDKTFSTDNQVISGQDFHGYVQITGKNVTIKNSIFRGGVKSCTSASALRLVAVTVASGAGIC